MKIIAIFFLNFIIHFIFVKINVSHIQFKNHMHISCEQVTSVANVIVMLINVTFSKQMSDYLFIQKKAHNISSLDVVFRVKKWNP